MTKKQTIIPQDVIERKILFLRGKKVMLDRDLAMLYGVETKQLKRAVKRHIDRFPRDFMFTMTKKELENWRCQFGTSNSELMGIRHVPMAFTEQGIAMLSSVLNSHQAIQINIQIMRTFTKMRKMFESHKTLKQKIDAMEKKYDTQFQIVFNAIRKLLEPTEPKPKRKIGFR